MRLERGDRVLTKADGALDLTSAGADLLGENPVTSLPDVPLLQVFQVLLQPLIDLAEK